MENKILLSILQSLAVDNIKHLKIEWYEGNDLKCFEYHQIDKE